MKTIDYEKWDHEGYSIVVNGKNVVVAAEKITNDADFDLWSQEEIVTVVRGLAASWRLPDVDEMNAMVEKGLLSEGGRTHYWATKMSEVGIFNVKNLSFSCSLSGCFRRDVKAAARCVCDAAALME